MQQEIFENAPRVSLDSRIDPKNRIERDIGGCKVRLLFSLSRNEKVERQVLSQLMLVFDHKMQGLSNPRS